MFSGLTAEVPNQAEEYKLSAHNPFAQTCIGARRTFIKSPLQVKQAFTAAAGHITACYHSVLLIAWDLQAS